MKNTLIVATMFALAGVGALAAIAADEDAEPKYSIKDVMKMAHKKNSLKDKVVAGDATAAEKAKLLEMYESMAQLEPPKGDADSWKEKTTSLVAAAQAAVDGDADAAAKLKSASSCGACHKAHKGK